MGIGVYWYILYCIESNQIDCVALCCISCSILDCLSILITLQTYHAANIGYFALVTLFTTVIYSVTIARLFATLNSSSNVNKHTIVVKPSHIVFVWILPFGIALLPFTTGSYGRNRSDLYCWIKTDTHNETTNNAGYAWEFFTLYLWVIMAISYNFFVYSTVVRRIHQWQVSITCFPLALMLIYLAMH